MNKIRAKFYAIIFWQTSVGEVLNKFYDLKLFFKHSFHNKLKTKQNYEAYLTKQYHILEKGLALPKTRKNFGIEKINKLIKISEEYHNKFGTSDLLKTIASALHSYLNYNKEFELANSDLYKSIVQFIDKHNTNNNGGIKLINPTYFPEYELFVKNRSSIRIFNNVEVSNDLILKAVEIAKFSPSVCNRQSWKVHLYNPEDSQQLLRLQDGNNGFGHCINKLLIVTSDSKSFTKHESNQIFIDGGLFSMNLILALHSLELGSCCLNLCVPYIKEKQIKKEARIEESERLIMMIGVGHFNNNTKVAMSHRKNNSEILKLHI
ncbi:nitroreductase family protein [Chryseobacterium sp. TY3]